MLVQEFKKMISYSGHVPFSKYTVSLVYEWIQTGLITKEEFAYWVDYNKVLV